MNAQRHLTSEECAAWWERTLEPKRLLETSDHLQACAVCREELLGARPAKTSNAGVSYEEFVAWMEGNVDPIGRRDLRERLNNSPGASAELADLRRFREEMNQLPAHDYSLAEAAPGRSSWILPIAAGLAVSLAFLWWNNTQFERRGVALQDAGKRIVVGEDGSVLALGPLPEDLRHALREAISLGRAPIAPAVVELRGTREALAGAAEAGKGFRVLDPIGTLVETPQPILHWSQAEGATGYRVNLVSQKGGAVANSPLLDGRTQEWKPEQPLRADETYEWEVEALRGGEMMAKAPAPPEPEARFAVLPNDKRDDLEKLRAKFGRSHLIMGLAYARTGLLAQAQSEFEQLTKENPQSELAKNLRASLANAHPKVGASGR
ncbi:MAG TPA: hypothetical protein VGQ40_07580 [Chthoniobacterales bacterium]|nr:hypothetical protein [Chthoniobacterales bacterium]